MTRLLDIVGQFTPFLPSVVKAKVAVPARQKFFYTLLALLIFLVMSQIPLFGVKSKNASDPFYWMRVILASNRGTLMELGITPVVTSGMIMQLLQGAKLIDVNMDHKTDRALFSSSQKLLALLITVGQALAYILSGMYGDLAVLGVGNALALLLQLSAAGLVVIMLDELLQQGYGIGSGISLFIATNICETIVWKSLSPTTINVGRGSEFEGALVATVHYLLTKDNKLKALYEAFFGRAGSLANMTNLMATLFVFSIVIYLQGFRVDIRIKNRKQRGVTDIYPVKLFYTSNMPIILQAALVSNLYFVSQLLWRKFPSNPLIALFGRWTDEASGGPSKPVGGLAYYMSPPGSLSGVLADPLRMVLYLSFILASCALFSRWWIEVAGNSSRDVAKQLIQQDNVIVNRREDQGSVKRELDRYIPIAASFGGMCIGGLSVFADLLGAVGTGTGILLAVTIIYQYYEEYEKSDISGVTQFYHGM